MNERSEVEAWMEKRMRRQAREVEIAIRQVILYRRHRRE